MKQNIIIIGLVAIAIIVALWVVNVRTAKAPGPVTCTMEAKLCPDGSYVGRTGPNCEFAPCPTTATTTATSTLAIGASATINGTTIHVLNLVGDSRCPVDVQCIQAGTVRVGVSIDSSSQAITFTLGQPQVVGNATVTLASVTPAQRYSKQTLQSSDYSFTFSVVPKVTPPPPPINSGVRGTVMLGPTCPVERIPPDPACADKPYATAIIVYRSGSQSPFIIGNSDASGAFKFSLPPGSYTLAASGGTTLPRCSDVSVTVPRNAYATTTISCDSGIR